MFSVCVSRGNLVKWCINSIELTKCCHASFWSYRQTVISSTIKLHHTYHFKRGQRRLDDTHLFIKRSISALYNRNVIHHWRAFHSCARSPTVNHLSCKVLDFSGAFGHMGTLWCTLFHRQMITGEGSKQRQEGGGGTVLSMTSSSSLSPQEEQWFLPLNLIQHSSTDNTTERLWQRKRRFTFVS